MATLREIREGLAEALATIPGLQENPYMLSAPTSPSTEIFPGEIVYDQTTAGRIDEVMMTVRVTVSANLDIASQMELDEFLAPSGERSLKAALEADPTLGGRVLSTHVQAATGYLVVRFGQQTFLSCDWRVQVMTAAA